jgi:hypothetical protein
VCSARARPKSSLTPPQNYPPDWKRFVTPTLPNQAGNPASTSISIGLLFRRTHPPYGGLAVGRVCSARMRPNSPQTPPQNYPPGLGTPRYSQRLQTRRVIRRPPPSAFGLFLRRTHPPYDGPTVGRVCSARVGPNPPQTPPQNYPPDWERRATPTFPNQAGNPAPTLMSIRASFPPDTPALRLVSRRAGVFCASETESSPDTTAELPAGLGTPRHPNLPKPGG